MKVFVAGASGAIGMRMVPQLIAHGHTVTAMTRSEQKARALREMGAETAIADGLDRSAVMKAMMHAEPDVVVHQLTALAGMSDFKNFDKEFEMTNRLRTEGTDVLIGAAQAAGAKRFVIQSYGNWIYERTGTALKTEDDALDPHPPANQTKSLAAIRYLEARVLSAEGLEGVVLRYGGFYGPGTGLEIGGDMAEMVRKRRFPIIGDGSGVWTFIHIDDAAAATVAAVERGAPGIYNIVDDEPARVSDWLPELARVLGSKPPRHLPLWVGKLVAGDVVVSMMTQIRGASNAKAKRELSWTPKFRNYHEGFANGLRDQSATSAAA